MAQDGSNLGEKALSKVVEVGITSQLDAVKDIAVDIRTDPGDLIQGEINSAVITGKGLVMKQDLRVEAVEVCTNKVAVNPLGAVLGNIELTRSTDAKAHLILTEVDLNRAVNSEYLQQKLQGLKMQVDGNLVTIDVQEVDIQLLDDNHFVITANLSIRELGKPAKLSASIIPSVKDNGHRIAFEILSVEEEGITKESAISILEELTNLLDLRNFDIPDIDLRLDRLNIEKGKMVIQAQSQIQQISL